MEEDDMSRRVSGTMPHFELDLTHLHAIAALQPAVRREYSERRETVTAARLRQLIDPELICDVRAFNRQLESLDQRSSSAAMVEMTMGDEDFVERDVDTFDRTQNALDIAPRVYNCTTPGLLAHQQRAVLLKRRDRDDRELDRHQINPRVLSSYLR